MIGRPDGLIRRPNRDEDAHRGLRGVLPWADRFARHRERRHAAALHLRGVQSPLTPLSPRHVLV